MQAQLRPNVIKSVFWVLSKIWNKVYNQLVVSEKEINLLKEMASKKIDNIVLVPAHKSYVDFLLISYIHFYFQIDLPFFCSPEDMLHINFFSYLLKSGGGYF